MSNIRMKKDDGRIKRWLFVLYHVEQAFQPFWGLHSTAYTCIWHYLCERSPYWRWNLQIIIIIIVFENLTLLARENESSKECLHTCDGMGTHVGGSCVPWPQELSNDIAIHSGQQKFVSAQICQSKIFWLPMLISQIMVILYTYMYMYSGTLLLRTPCGHLYRQDIYCCPNNYHVCIHMYFNTWNDDAP